MELKLYQVDAFGRGVFTGNPAAVVPLQDWLDDAVLAAIAAENNLSETAFIIRRGGDWDLRWFTPAFEVALCGHATLGAAHAICEFIDPNASELRFNTRQSGVLTVTKKGNVYEMRFPAIATEEVATPDALVAALGVAPSRTLIGHYSPSEADYLAIFDTEEAVQDLKPDMGGFSALGTRGAICSAAGQDVDFVSRYFAPAAGIPEDPVTGSAHCILTPYWAAAFGKTALEARQISARGGWLGCVLDGESVRLTGQAFTYLEGSIVL